MYRANTAAKGVYQQFRSKLDESFCFLKRAYVQHWCFTGVPAKFLVTTKNAWDPHPVNVTNVGAVGPNYTVLAENDRACAIVEHNNTIATVFHIDCKSPEVAQMVANFVKSKVMLIQAQERIDLPLELTELKNRGVASGIIWQIYTGTRISELGLKHKLAIKALTQARNGGFTKVFKRSGLSYSKRLQRLMVDNNAMNKAQLRPRSRSNPRQEAIKGKSWNHHVT